MTPNKYSKATSLFAQQWLQYKLCALVRKLVANLHVVKRMKSFRQQFTK